MPALPIAISAAILLAVADFFLINIGLLGNELAQIVTMCAVLGLMMAAFVLRRSWLIYVAQTGVFISPLYNAAEAYVVKSGTITTSNQFGWLYFIIIMALTYVLAWLVARGD